MQELMSKDMLLTMWKQSSVSCLAIIYYHLFKFVDLFLFFGVNPDSSIDLHRKLTEVLFVTSYFKLSAYTNTDGNLNCRFQF